MILAELAMEAGLPSGVLNIVHGTNVRFGISNLFSTVFHLVLAPLLDYCFKRSGVLNIFGYSKTLIFHLMQLECRVSQSSITYTVYSNELIVSS